MASPIWQTISQLGSYKTNIPYQTTLVANPVLPSTSITYTLISGSLPNNVFLDSLSGVVSGTPYNIIDETVYDFVVRATDDLGNIKDRTFSITMVNSNKPHFYLPPQNLLTTIDSVYVRYDIKYINEISSNQVFMSVIGGSLPPGLELLPEGIIVGYPDKPITSTGSYTQTTYNFTLKLTSELGDDTCNYNITIKNQDINQLPNNRRPVILNIYPLHFPVPVDDIYYEFYLNDKNLPDYYSGDNFAFKIIGYDFDDSQLTYTFYNLPDGLVGDSSTGWITGSVSLNVVGKMRYDFSVSVCKTENSKITSDKLDLSLLVINKQTPVIKWITDSNLGTINTASISELKIQAQSTENLIYQLAGGKLPPNLTLLSTGEIVGRVPHQPSSSYMNLGEQVDFTFTVNALSASSTLVNSVKEFTVTVYQSFDKPWENVYFKAYPDFNGKTILKSLLNSDTLIPINSLYRPTDVNFGKAYEVTCVHAYGMLISDIENYMLTLQENHYNRQVVLGPLKVAVARDSNFNVIYEVVYSELLDDLELNRGVSMPQTITWPRNINLNTNNNSLINNQNISIISTHISSSSTTNYTRTLHPASLLNMKYRLNTFLSHYTDSSVLPSWMTSQQLNGEPLGFLEAWVLCYALPGKGQSIIDNINKNWSHSLNQISFTIDRYIIDKSFTYNYNSNFSYPFWSNLPSAYPSPDPIHSNDVPVVFPRKTILPTS